MIKNFISEVSGPLVVMPGLDYFIFTLTLITRYSYTKRQPKGSFFIADTLCLTRVVKKFNFFPVSRNQPSQTNTGIPFFLLFLLVSLEA